MKKVIYIIAFIVMLLFVGVFIGYLMDNDGHLNDRDAEFLGCTEISTTELTLYNDKPMNLYMLLYEINHEPYYRGYNNSTFNWMRSLDQREVFISEDAYVIMDTNDASKIHPTYDTDTATTDTYNEYYINCEIVENRSLGGNSHKNIVLVKDVNFLGNETFYYEV